MRKYMICLMLLLFLISCSTPYQRKGFLGGYYDRQLKKDYWVVGFYGNGYTSQSKADDCALYRCAEITRNSGFTYFIILNEYQNVFNENVVIGSDKYTTTEDSKGNLVTRKTSSATNMNVRKFNPEYKIYLTNEIPDWAHHVDVFEAVETMKLIFPRIKR